MQFLLFKEIVCKVKLILGRDSQYKSICSCKDLVYHCWLLKMNTLLGWIKFYVVLSIIVLHTNQSEGYCCTSLQINKTDTFLLIFAEVITVNPQWKVCTLWFAVGINNYD